MKKIAIMQPYFLPYIGYFQLINSVDEFVIYDNIKYTKKGWINRNRFLQNNKEATFTIPLKKDSDWKNVVDRKIAENFDAEKLVRQIKNSYSKAPYYNEGFPVFENLVLNEERNLFEYIYNSIKDICNFLNIDTKLIVSSDINHNHKLESQERVLSICNALEATNYINLSGGKDLYNQKYFSDRGIKLEFIASKPLSYKQFNDDHISFLSILDLIMFNDKDTIYNFLHEVNIS